MSRDRLVPPARGRNRRGEGSARPRAPTWRGTGSWVRIVAPRGGIIPATRETGRREGRTGVARGARSGQARDRGRERPLGVERASSSDLSGASLGARRGRGIGRPAPAGVVNCRPITGTACAITGTISAFAGTGRPSLRPPAGGAGPARRLPGAISTSSLQQRPALRRAGSRRVQRADPWRRRLRRTRHLRAVGGAVSGRDAREQGPSRMRTGRCEDSDLRLRRPRTA